MAMNKNRTRSARGQSSRPPASTGRMSRPGENHDCDTCTAATAMNAVTRARTRATRRFPVMSCRATHPLTVCQAERTACRGRATTRAIMMAELYTPAGLPDTHAGQARRAGWPRMAAVAGVSMVAVLPSHRRRGALTCLMHRQLADIAERGEAVAALFASETPIYGRYGYGRASWHLTLNLARGHGALAATAPSDPSVRLRIAEPRSAHAEMGKVYELAMAERPGLYARTEPWWDRLTHEPDSDSDQPMRCVLAEDDAGPRGYALFTSEGRWEWEEGSFLPSGVLDLHEAIAVDPAAATALWSDLLSRDLITTL